MQITRFAPPQAASRGSSSKSSGSQLGDVVDNLTVSPLTLGTDFLDATMGMAYATKGFPEAFQNAGYVMGAAHLAAAVGYTIGCADQDNDTIKHRFTYAASHALAGMAHIAGAAGAGAWVLAPIAGSILASTLEDYRSRTH